MRFVVFPRDIAVREPRRAPKNTVEFLVLEIDWFVDVLQNECPDGVATLVLEIADALDDAFPDDILFVHS